MGDGGVACVPLQHIMERFQVSETYCGGKNGNKLSSKSPLKLTGRKLKMRKVKREEVLKRRVCGKSKLGVKSGQDVENGEILQDKVVKEEVEEGELGTLKWSREGIENEEFVPEKQRKFELKSEIEKGDTVTEKWRKGEVQKGDCFPGKWQKREVEKGEYDSGWGRSDGAADKIVKNESGSWRLQKDELEKGEFVPERWRKSEVVKDDYSYSKLRRHDSSKDKGWKYERERTPSSDKYSAEREFSRSGSQHTKRSSRWETCQDRIPRMNSKITDEESSLKNELSNGKNHGREFSSGNRLKRHGDDSERKQYNSEFGECTGLKSRRLSDDGSRSSYSEHYSRHSIDKSFKSCSSRNISSDRYSSRHCESSLSSKVFYDKHNSSPRHFERSPRDRVRCHDHRDWSPARRDKSPYDRSRHHGYRNRSPSYSEHSPHDQVRHHGRRERTPSYSQRSPPDQRRPSNLRETSQKNGASEKLQGHFGSNEQDEKLHQKEHCRRDSQNYSVTESKDSSTFDTGNGSLEKNAINKFYKEEQSQSSSLNIKQNHEFNGPAEEVPSMEEDMDICDTPPHAPIMSDSTMGKWFYLDQFGVERGPSRLSDLKTLVEDGFLVSDHMIKHADSDRWVTVENAVSPLSAVNFPSIVSDTITQLASPPEAPGNLSVDVGDAVRAVSQVGEEILASYSESIFCPNDSLVASEPSENFHIDQRIGALLEGVNILPGRELETIRELLQMTFDGWEWDTSTNIKDCAVFLQYVAEAEHDDQSAVEATVNFAGLPLKETAELKSGVASFDKENASPSVDTIDCFSGLWSCKGADWKRNDEAAQDRLWRKKVVLNDQYPLCQMPKSGHEDPRWERKDELYYPSHSTRLDLSSWAFASDDWNDCDNVSRLNQTKPIIVRGVKGIMLPVIRINACVVKEHGSFVSEPRSKVRGKERYSSRSNRQYSATSDAKRSSEESVFRLRNVHDQELQGSGNSTTSITIPKDRLCTADDLQLHLGEWYYLDGAGHERGPLSFSELPALVDQGIIPKHSSVFRKNDKAWVPVISTAETSEAALDVEEENKAVDCSGACLLEPGVSTPSRSFHTLHPQFIGYARGKLHELVMRSYKSRELAAAINEVLDPWINARQPKKELDKYLHNPAVNNRYQKIDQLRTGKRPRLLGEDSDEEYDIGKDIHAVWNDEYLFDDLWSDHTFFKEDSASTQSEMGSWGLLDGRVLARVFHMLRTDMKSLVSAALACKHWRSALKSYKDISKQVDLSSVAPNCTDSMIWNIMNGYKKEKVTSLVLCGCTNITCDILEEILRSFPNLSSLDIRGCGRLEELAHKYPSINWVKAWGSHSNIGGLKDITERSSSIRKTYNGLERQMDDSSGLRDYLENSDKRESANQLFRRSLYKRSKVYDARKSSSILSRDAQLRLLAMKKSVNGYKRMGEFVTLSLKDIMKENTFEFFVPKVAEVEKRMQNGYYASRGVRAIKEDISRMCRDAMRAKNREDAGGMNRIITLFIRLASTLEGSAKSFYVKDEMIKALKDDSPPGFSSASSKYKRLTKVTEKKCIGHTDFSSVIGSVEYGEYASDREIRRRLSKLNKKSLESGSETSDDFDGSSEESRTEGESTASEAESEWDARSEAGTGDLRVESFFTPDDGLDSVSDEREWGARMTKAGLVPPVTRKYEAIDRYLIVADQKEVMRKMQVCLPEDYTEKLEAQKNGTEESDMEIPEVKEYKPRKRLDDEVIEQEVYGIDPYTHNLVLDSMPDDSDWPLLDKHVFIEDVLLRTLNGQVRHFTGTDNTPMMYPLQPVFQEILETAEEEHDVRTVKLCQFILKSIESRSEDSYVAYRKGLGVVCNKQGGFVQEDFVVEFLGEVYPAWKWFEKQDGIRSLQKNNKDPAPEFYNIYLERPKGDADGYDLLVVDAMHKANYASRICHSCRPNCEAKVTAVDGHYQIGIYGVRQIGYGEEITFDYNSVTESKEEYEASVCLCGSQVCRGSYLNLTGEGAFQKVLKEHHGILDRHQLLIEACELNSVSEEDYIDLGRAGLGSCLLGGLPDWLIAYVARLVRFINFERTLLPDEILRHNVEEKKKFFTDVCVEVERSDAEVQAEGVYNQRLQNLSLTLDKVKYVMRYVFGDPKKAPPPLERLNPEAAISFIWKGEGSLVEELIEYMTPHMEDGMLNDLKSKIHAYDPSQSDDIQRELQKSLIWLRDEVRNLPCTYKCRHDAASDLIHIYAHTKCFFRIREYETVTSPPVYISPLDLGPKYANKLGSSLHEYRKTYGENYCLGQLIFWHIQTNADPDCNLARLSKGCLSLPDIGSFYAKVQKPSRQRVYGPRTVKFMLSRMEKQRQKPWPKDKIWSFKSDPKVFGSPMLDAVLYEAPLDEEMVHWLKHRPAIFHAMWDR